MGRKNFKTHRRASASLSSPILCGPPARWSRELKSVGPNAKQPVDFCGRCERSVQALAAGSKRARKSANTSKGTSTKRAARAAARR